jgi:hypothetical protein
MTFIPLFFCMLTGTATMNIDESQYETLFDRWRQSLQAELDSGRSFVNGDERLLESLGLDADNHADFLLTRLQHDFFTVIVLDESELAADHWAELHDVSALQDKQVIWLKILGSTVYKRRFLRWREAISNGIHDRQRMSLAKGDLQYLGEHTKENLGFLVWHLKHDERTAIILENSSLRTKYDRIKDALGTRDNSTKDKKRIWLAVLLEELGAHIIKGEKGRKDSGAESKQIP